jgi:hypothetical protein
MPGKISKLVSVSACLLLFQLFNGIVSAQKQPYLDKKITVTFVSSSIPQVFRILSEKSGVKFSYNPEIFPVGKTFTGRFANMALRDILKEILDDNNVRIKEIGNQIVLYSGIPEPFPLKSNQQLIRNKPVLLPSEKKNPDTLYLYQLDTLVINHYDTITREVIVYQRDTIFQSLPPDTAVIPKSTTEITLSDSLPSAKKGFSASFYIQMQPENVYFTGLSNSDDLYKTLMQKVFSKPNTGFTLGISGNYQLDKMGISAGLAYTLRNERFVFDTEKITGGFFDTDTVETYYSLHGNDTLWFYITDSTWVEKQTEKISVHQNNRYHYLTIPLDFSYIIFEKPNYNLFVSAGVTVSFLSGYSASHINPDDTFEVTAINKNQLNSFLFSWQAGAGICRRITQNTSFFGEISYYSQLNNSYTNFELDKRYGHLNLKLGMSLKL